MITDNTMIRPQSLDRPELAFHVIVTDPATAAARLRAELRALPGRFAERPDSFYEPGRGLDTFSGIVFCPTVNGRDRGISATREQAQPITGRAVRFAGSKPKDVGWSQWRDEKGPQRPPVQKTSDATVMVATKGIAGWA